VGEGVRLFLKQLWNTYGFYVLYANVNGVEPGGDVTSTTARPVGPLAPGAVTEQVTERLDAYDATAAGRAIAEYVDELSNWYVRARAGASGTATRRVRDAAPLPRHRSRSCSRRSPPFIADEMYENLDGGEPSVTCATGRTAGARDVELEEAMAVAREAVASALARGRVEGQVRQPLREAGRRRGRPRARRDRASLRRRPRRAQRHGAALRRAAPTSSARTRSSELPLARAAVRQSHAAVADAVASLDPVLTAEALREGRTGRDQHRGP
jgi:isoleucyl-tRNA synthetase